MDNFYELTNIQCDLSISKNKLQMRFKFDVTLPKKEILDKKYYIAYITKCFIKIYLLKSYVIYYQSNN